MNSPATYSVKKHTSPVRQLDMSHNDGGLNRQCMTEVRLDLRVRQSGTSPSGSVSDTALSNVGKLMKDLSPEVLPVGEILETAGM